MSLDEHFYIYIYIYIFAAFRLELGRFRDFLLRVEKVEKVLFVEKVQKVQKREFFLDTW